MAKNEWRSTFATHLWTQFSSINVDFEVILSDWVNLTQFNVKSFDVLFSVVWFVGRAWLLPGSGRRYSEVVKEWWAPCWLLWYLWLLCWCFDTCEWLPCWCSATCDHCLIVLLPVITLLIFWYLRSLPDCSVTCDYFADVLIPVITYLFAPVITLLILCTTGLVWSECY